MPHDTAIREADSADARLRTAGFAVETLPGATFGRRLAPPPGGAAAAVEAAESAGDALENLLHEANGLLVLSGMQAISAAPDLLVRLSRLFGPEVEDYRRTLTPASPIKGFKDEEACFLIQGSSGKRVPLLQSAACSYSASRVTEEEPKYI